MLPDWTNAQSLMDFWGEVNRAPVRVARALFPDRHDGYVADTRHLASAAANRAAELGCRDRGDETAGDCYAIAVKASLDRLSEWGYVLLRDPMTKNKMRWR